MAKTAAWLKLLGALALTLVLGAAALLVALRAFFPEPKLRAMVVDGARKQLGREVALERVSLGLTGLTLEGLRVSEAPDLSAGDFLSVRRFHLRPSWRALLKKKLVVASVSAEGLVAVVVKNADGSYNFSSLAAAAAPSPAPVSAPAAERPELSIRHASLRGAQLTYRDEAARQAWAVTDADLTVDGFAMNAPFGLDASLRLRGESGGRPLDARLSFDGEVDPARGELGKMKVKAKSFSVEAEGLTLKGSADLEGLAPPKARFDVELSAVGKSLLEAEGEVRLSSAAGGDFLADVKAESSGVDTTLLAKWLPGTVPAVTLPAATLALKAERKGAALDVKTFALKWKDGGAEGRVTAKGLGTAAPAYDGRVVLDLVLPAVAKGQYPFLKLPPDLSLPSAKVRGSIEMTGDAARFEDFKVTVPQGSVTVSGAVARLGSAKPQPDLDVKLALDLPSVKAGDLPAKLPPSVPPSLVLPAVKLDGGLAVKGEDVRFKGLTMTFPTGKATLSGAALGALGAKLRPELELAGSFSLPALTDKDLPFAGVPSGLQMPPSSWELDLDYTLERLRVRALRLKTGGNDVAVEGSVGDPAGRMAYDLLVKARTLVFHELTQLTPATRELELKGAGYAALSVTGAGAKPVFAGKAQFKELGATVAGLPLSEFNGTVSFDEDRVDIPNVKGKVAEGRLEADVTVLQWAKAPELQLQASIDRFDLGRFLAAQEKMKSAAPASAPAAGGSKTPEAGRPALRTRGRFEVATLTYPSTKLQGMALSWDLNGLKSDDLRPLNGEFRVTAAGGRVGATKGMGEKNALIKVLLALVAVLQDLGRVVAGFPDLSDMEVNSLVGDYGIKNGVMRLRESQLDAKDKKGVSASITATGSVDLPHEDLNVTVVANMGKLLPPLTVGLTGPASNPKRDIKYGKILADGVQNLLKNLTTPK